MPNPSPQVAIMCLTANLLALWHYISSLTQEAAEAYQYSSSDEELLNNSPSSYGDQHYAMHMLNNCAHGK